MEYGVSLSALDSLNNDLPDANAIIADFESSYSRSHSWKCIYRTAGRHSLDIANVYGQSTESIIAANTHRSSSEYIYPGQTTDIVIRLLLEDKSALETYATCRRELTTVH